MYYATKIMGAILGIPPSVETDGYWKHYQTDVVTPILLSDANITNGVSWARPSWFDLASEIKIPSGITDVNHSDGMGILPEATILDLPASLWFYNTGFLKDTPKLITVYARNPIPSTAEQVAFGPNIGNMAAFDGLYVPLDSLTAYQTTEPWLGFSSVIKGY